MAAEENQNYLVYVLCHGPALVVVKVTLTEIAVWEGEIEIENLFDGESGDMFVEVELVVVAVEVEVEVEH